MKEYSYRGGLVLVELHDKHLRSFVETWKQAKEKNIVLPATDDTDYESLETLLAHLLRSSRGYITWICEKLELADPGIEQQPEASEVITKLESYLEHLLEKWKTPLITIPEEKYHHPVFKTKWGVEFCIESMLEHAVMHPIRHEYQLQNLLKNQS